MSGDQEKPYEPVKYATVSKATLDPATIAALEAMNLFGAPQRIADMAPEIRSHIGVLSDFGLIEAICTYTISPQGMAVLEGKEVDI